MLSPDELLFLITEANVTQTIFPNVKKEDQLLIS